MARASGVVEGNFRDAQQLPGKKEICSPRFRANPIWLSLHVILGKTPWCSPSPEPITVPSASHFAPSDSNRSTVIDTVTYTTRPVGTMPQCDRLAHICSTPRDLRISL